MDDTRFTRLETRVDEIKEDVAELKAGQKVTNVTMSAMKDDFNEHISLVNKHVAGDNKIINKLEPLLDVMGEMVHDYSFKKEQKQRRNDKLKDLKMKLGIPIIILGGFSALIKFLSTLF